MPTILGRTAAFDGDSMLEMLATHPQTARYVCTKLWTYFAYENPEPKVVESLVAVWRGTKGDILAVVDAITRRPEFYSDRCVRQRVKSPPDLVVGMARAMGVGRSLLASREADARPTTPIPKAVLDTADEVARYLGRMGMALFQPPDVAGWNWGTAWVSPAMMLERIRFRGVRQSAEGVQEALWAKAPATAEELALALLDLFDVPLDEARRATLIAALERGGGVKALAKPTTALGLLRTAMAMLMAAPETHLC